MSFHLLLPTLPVYVLGLGGTEGDVGLVMSAFAMASVFMRPFAGQWVDRGHKKDLMLAGAVVYVTSAILYYLVPHVKGLVAVRFLHGLGIGMYSTAASSLISDAAPRKRRGEALGYFLLATSLAMAIGPAVGILIVERLSYFALFASSAILAAIVFICTLAVSVSARPSAILNGATRPRRVGGWHRKLATGVGSLISLEAAFPAIALAFGSATYGSVASFLAVYARSRGITRSGVFFTAFALSMFATRTIAGKISDRRGRAAVIVPGLIAICVGMGILATATSISEFVLAAIVYGVGFSVMQPTVTALMVEHVRPERRGAAMGTLLAMYDVGMASGGILAGKIAERLSLPAIYWSMSFVGACGLIFFLSGYKRYCTIRARAVVRPGSPAEGIATVHLE